jgi:hypothetical protein
MSTQSPLLVAAELKGPPRSSICEGCNGVLTGLAKVRGKKEKKKRERKSGDIYCCNRRRGAERDSFLVE